MSAAHGPDTLADFADLLDGAPGARRSDGRGGRIAVVVFLVTIMAALVGSGGYVWWASSAPLAAPVLTSTAPDATPGAPAVIPLPSGGSMLVSVEGAQEYLGPQAAGTFVSMGGNDPRPLASITKLVTAMVVLDAHPLVNANDAGPIISFTTADTDLYDQFYVRGVTIARMPDGSSMSQRDALATMLLPSASNYSVALARWSFGSESAFVDAARSWLRANGLHDTRIVDATGVDERNTSTPADLVALGRLAAANPVIAAIAATRSISVVGPGTVTNTNGLLGVLGVNGLKTGNLGDGSFNLLFTSNLDVGIGAPLKIVGVRMGGETHDSTDADIVAVLQGIENGFHDVQVGRLGEEIGTVATPWGSSATVVVAKNAALRAWSDTPVAVTLDTVAPQRYADGEVVGTVTWTAGPNTATADVKISGTLEEPTLWWRLTHPDELG